MNRRGGGVNNSPEEGRGCRTVNWRTRWIKRNARWRLLKDSTISFGSRDLCRFFSKNKDIKCFWHNICLTSVHFEKHPCSQCLGYNLVWCGSVSWIRSGKKDPHQKSGSRSSFWIFLQYLLIFYKYEKFSKIIFLLIINFLEREFCFIYYLLIILICVVTI